MSLGFLTESALIPKKAVPIKVDSSSVCAVCKYLYSTCMHNHVPVSVCCLSTNLSSISLRVYYLHACSSTRSPADQFYNRPFKSVCVRVCVVFCTQQLRTFYNLFNTPRILYQVLDLKSIIYDGERGVAQKSLIERELGKFCLS